MWEGTKYCPGGTGKNPLYLRGNGKKRTPLSLREGQENICAGSRTTAGGGAGSLRLTHTPDSVCV